MNNFIRQKTNIHWVTLFCFTCSLFFAKESFPSPFSPGKLDVSFVIKEKQMDENISQNFPYLVAAEDENSFFYFFQCYFSSEDHNQSFANLRPQDHEQCELISHKIFTLEDINIIFHHHMANILIHHARSPLKVYAKVFLQVGKGFITYFSLSTLFHAFLYFYLTYDKTLNTLEKLKKHSLLATSFGFSASLYPFYLLMDLIFFPKNFFKDFLTFTGISNTLFAILGYHSVFSDDFIPHPADFFSDFLIIEVDDLLFYSETIRNW